MCKAPVRNLPEVTPRARSEAASDGGGSAFGENGGDHGATAASLAPYLADSVPGSADIIFDCIRVTWVAMIICILFFEMNLAAALWTGLVVGVAYTMFARAMYRQQLAAIQVLTAPPFRPCCIHGCCMQKRMSHLAVLCVASQPGTSMKGQ